jgi:predicted nucleic acid-binding protein
LVVDSVLPIGRRDVEQAKEPRIVCQGALHVAVMARHNVAQLIRFDRGFDAYPGTKRLA